MSAKSAASPGTLRVLNQPWRDSLVVCRKCGKKLKGGFGPKNKHSLSRMLRLFLRENGQRQALRIVESGCLGVCPKRAVALLQGSRPGQVLLMPEGLPAEDAARCLGVAVPPATAPEDAGDAGA
ncbi:hypothetical protein [Rhizosaccharibacter radicis]|uniref:(2Fe-2S) ferredoxin domain-containing protein n=1 Tax=Rhizosaccharibacter radicis TaxID=2782605 RepID=A0ABT1VST2_9PROT|nr:hypothetical protein [Acetobacteraceae bacterium KSS12]